MTNFGPVPTLKSTCQLRVNWRYLRMLAAATLGLFVIPPLTQLSGLRINTSYSLPIGLYAVSNDLAANLIEFCPTGVYSEVSAGRGYRAKGVCPDGAVPLLKPIVAHEGDEVDLGKDGIAVNGTRLPNTAPLGIDRKGRPLDPFPFGRYRVAQGEVWVASTYNPGSFDSRYMGPIQFSLVRSRLRPVCTFHKFATQS